MRCRQTDVMRWLDEQLKADPAFARAVEERQKEMRAESEALEAQEKASRPRARKRKGR